MDVGAHSAQRLSPFEAVPYQRVLGASSRCDGAVSSVISTESSANLSPLHQQRFREREIVVSENSRLHLLWIHDPAFIKPLPRYLLLHLFWEQFLLSKPSKFADRHHATRKVAMGYLRTYRYLIQHESDFVAQKMTFALFLGI